MAKDSSFVSHYHQLDDEELLEYWQKQLVPEARAALQQELSLRGLQTPDRSSAQLGDAAPAKPASAAHESRTTWWKGLKLYGAVAPLVVINVLQTSAKVSIGAVWLLLLAVVGYAMAVVWIIKTQTVESPWGKGTTIALFVVVHFVVMMALVATIRGLGSIGQS